MKRNNQLSTKGDRKMKNMSRREFLTVAAGGAAAAATMPLAGCSSELACSRGKAAKRPNIIFLLTDDQRWDTMGCAGNTIIQTPNMDDIANNGVLFKNAFVTTSICCTSRASIFAGQYARRHNINDFRTDFSESALAQTYPMLLGRAGYRTGFIGKYGVGTNMPAEKFDFWGGIGGQPKYENVDSDGNYKHLTQIMGEESIEFLRSCSKDQPFCLSVSFKAPHVQDEDPRQFIYDPVYKDLYKDAVIPTPQTAAPHFFDDLPAFLKENSEARHRWDIRFSTPEKFQESVKGYYRLITGVDVVIGRIRNELERLGLDDNTIIMLTGDNGFYLAERGFAGKWFAHEESIRIPLIVFDPRAKQKNRGIGVEQMALNIDIAPTILELAGVKVPDEMQGRSLMPLLAGRKVRWRTDFLYEHLFDYARIPMSEGVRTERWKYIRYFQQQPVYEELYDLAGDPHETVNLVKDQKYQQTLNSLRKRCDQLIKEKSKIKN